MHNNGATEPLAPSTWQQAIATVRPKKICVHPWPGLHSELLPASIRTLVAGCLLNSFIKTHDRAPGDLSCPSTLADGPGYSWRCTGTCARIGADGHISMCRPRVRPHVHAKALATPYVHLLILITNSNTARLAPTETAACRALQVCHV